MENIKIIGYTNVKNRITKLVYGDAPAKQPVYEINGELCLKTNSTTQGKNYFTKLSDIEKDVDGNYVEGLKAPCFIIKNKLMPAYYTNDLEKMEFID